MGAVEVHVDWRMTPSEWEQLRTALLRSTDLPYIKALADAGTLRGHPGSAQGDALDGTNWRLLS